MRTGPSAIKLRTYTGASVLVIDDVGTPFDRAQANAFLQVVTVVRKPLGHPS